MQDPNFLRTVVLLAEHTAEGSVGFVLNRPMELKLCDIIQELPECAYTLFVGGPVQHNTLHYLHRLGEKLDGSVPLVADIWWGGDFDQLADMLRSGEAKEEDIRFFVGYSGWGKGQLDAEMESSSWIVAPENANYLFEESSDQLWQKILKDMGIRYKIVANYPQNPQLN